MPVRFGSSGGGGGAGDGVDITLEDTVEVDDGFAAELTVAPDDVAVGDAVQSMSLSLSDRFEVDDGVSSVDLTATLNDTTDVADAARFIVEGMRSSADTYLRRDQGGANFGTETTMEAKANTPVVNNARHAYIAWNAANWSGLTHAGVPYVEIFVEHDALGNQPLTFEAYTHTSAPFVETTATWNNTEPPPGTRHGGTETVTVPAGPPGWVRFDHIPTIGAATQSAVNNGRWFYIRLLGNTGVGGDLVTFTISSRDAGGAGPIWKFEATR